MPFTYARIIRVQDTDATGVLYFANQLQIALEAFEELMRQSGFSFTEMVQKREFLLPVVHTEADFFLPLTVGEEIEVTLYISHIGRTSFTHTSEIKKGGVLAGTVSIVHVVYCPFKKKSQSIPEEFKRQLHRSYKTI